MRNFFLFVAASLTAISAISADIPSTPKLGGPEEAKDTFSMDESGCGGESNLADTQCLGRYLKWLDDELNRTNARALLKMPESSPTDVRKSQEQLKKSQRAWLKYKAENCTLEGGLEGGSNLWVAHFAAICEEREVKQRIRFLKGIGE